MKKPILTALLLALVPTLLPAGEFITTVEGGAAWFSRNDVRIPGDTGTKFDMLDLTGEGPDPYVRLSADYAFNPRHSLRMLLAPLEVDGTGTLGEETQFAGQTYRPGVATKGTYQFNTYRLTYRYTFHRSRRWTWGAGAALLVRDARIGLEQGSTKSSDYDLGLVPLLHLYGRYAFSDQLATVLDVEGLGSPQGRAVDAALMLAWQPMPDWTFSGGYRTLEGGADNDSVYTFAWIHYALLSATYRF
jgi:hypothetical protein